MRTSGELLQSNPKKSLRLLLRRQNQTTLPTGEIMISKINQPPPPSQFQK